MSLEVNSGRKCDDGSVFRGNVSVNWRSGGILLQVQGRTSGHCEIAEVTSLD